MYNPNLRNRNPLAIKNNNKTLKVGKRYPVQETAQTNNSKYNSK